VKELKGEFFHSICRKATWKNPKVLSPEGEEHVKWVEKAVELKKKKKVEVVKLTPIPVRAASSPPSRPTQSSILTTPVHKKKMKTEHKCETKSPVTSRPGPVPDHPDNEFYEVERVIGAELYHGKVFYLIKWLGWEDEFDTWEPASGVKLAENALKDFTTKHG
jgi:Chromo (CHRromatin Organisation MOdifier) domain